MDRQWDWNKILSLLIALVYLVIASIWGESGDWLLLSGYLVLPLGCILFSKEVGGFVGISAKGVSVSRPTPGIFILIAGWVLLLMPVFVSLIGTAVS